jgi:transcriptional regulator with XRE-family HTH domain
MGNKIARRRKDLGMTQVSMADALSVTRQTVSRWEAGTVLPDIDKISDIARLLGVSCDYLLKDEIEECDSAVEKAVPSAVSGLLQEMKGRKVKLDFCEDEADIDLYDVVCTIVGFEGNWIKVSANTKKGEFEKLIPISSIFSIEIVKEAE